MLYVLAPWQRWFRGVDPLCVPHYFTCTLLLLLYLLLLKSINFNKRPPFDKPIHICPTIHQPPIIHYPFMRNGSMATYGSNDDFY